ncbi:MAG TPA: Gfo/Idh/MocA family oxidoreductase [Gaiellaceae bacterium]|nr:Gfo/Idh/MocA family oxidoreductase [Gaiellaceae bacterium]
MATAGSRGEGGMSAPLGVAVVGTGRAGMVHARNFAFGVVGAQLVALADPSEAALAAAAVETGCERTYADPRDAIADGAVEAVVIASPTFTHAELTVAALAAGKHVLCEKPLASTLDEAVTIAGAAAASDAVFLMAFMRRFDATWSSVAERVTAGEIGEPLFVRSTGRGPGLPPEWALDPSRSGGLIAEVNSHDIDSIRWFSGQEFNGVYAVGRAAKRPDLAERYAGFVDLVLATFELSGGALGEVDGACPADYGYDARVEIYGSEGVAFAGDPRRGSALLIRRGEAVAEPVRGWRDLFAAAYRAEDAHLVAVARGEDEPRTSVDDGVRALEAVFAVNRSLAEGAPVTLARVAAA